jgi:Zn-dependent M16 (insulinase) family peptidase
VASLASSYAASTNTTAPGTPGGPSGQIDLAKLTKGQIVNGFRTDAVYLTDSGKPVGARFKHMRSGFTFDLLSVQTAPQAFMWVNTPPTSDMGEPHTQEHLLLGKGNKGRSVATLEEMSMTSSTAMTMQWRTCYHFNTTAGPDVFYEQVQRRLDALLHPDYTDVEVVREVRNFGVGKDAKDGLLKLEEKGTVYNEMVSSVKSSANALWRAQYATLYGKHHPLYYMAGGSPEGLRQLTSDGIKAFRKDHYVLHNMGMIAAVPKNMMVAEVLTHLNTILSALEPEAVSPDLLNVSDVPVFPPPQPLAAPAGKIEIVGYPEKDAEKPGSIELYWPATRNLGADQELLLGLFLSNLAGDPATPLYKKFIDRRSRFMDLGATGVWASVSDDQGFPISVGLSSVAKDNINEKVIGLVREQVEKELATIASWKDGSPELTAFNARVRDRIIATRRSYGKFVNSPPGFGNRWQGSGWMGVFLTVGRGGGFYRSVTMKPEIAFAEKQLSAKTNIWRRYLSDWHMIGTVPFVVATRPDPALLTKEEEATKVRVAQETERLKKLYGAADDQEALRAYKSDYDKGTEQLEELAKHDTPAKLVKSLPLTTDDQLEYKVSMLGGVPLVSSSFDSMTGATAGLALRADSIEPDDLMYLSFLPLMINQVGVIINGKPVSYEQMLDLWRREILSVGCSISVNTMTDRCELIMRGSGNDPAEVDRAIIWMERLLKNPDWRTQNLPRIRDVVDHSLTGLRTSRQSGYEESWVHGVSTAYWRQDWPLYLNTRCFLTRTHSAQRLRWLLKGDAAPEAIKTFVAFMSKLSTQGEGAKREDLKALLEVLQGQVGAATPELFKVLVEEYKGQPKAVAGLTTEAAKDLSQDLTDIPDDSLKGDWLALCAEISHDVQVPPTKTLARFDQVRRKLLTTSGARLFVIGAGSTQQKMQAPLKALLVSLGSAPFKPVKYNTETVVLAHLKERDKSAERPIYIGFVNPNTEQGVFLNSAPALKYKDLDQESLLRYLAFNQYAGGGAHSIFMKTWGAGLAYGNGLRSGPNERMSYYADKTPTLPETIRFVAEQLKTAPKDLDLGDYAVAGAFSSMSAQSYEGRGESMAEAIVDGEPPEVVKRFRQAILDLRNMPDLAAALHERMLSQYGRVVPGLGVRGEDVPGAVYMVIGDEKQMKLYEEYLKSVVGPDTKLHRIYGRDFWQFGK